MKRLLLASLSILLMPAIMVPAVKAETTALNSKFLNSNTTEISEDQPRPFDLVYLAYQGYFSKEGIPSNEALIQAYEEGRVTPKNLVQSAVDADRLPPSVLNDKEYLSAVDFQLWGLLQIDRGR